VWEEIPFEQTVFGEDLRWGKSAVEAGYKVVYEPRSAVFHSHERGAMYDLRRHYMEGQVLLDLFGLAPTPNLALLLLNVLRFSASLALQLRQDEKSRAARLMPLVLRHAISSQTGTYLALKNGRLARVRPGISEKLDRFLSRGI
jgi:rhamnosyltransferase